MFSTQFQEIIILYSQQVFWPFDYYIFGGAYLIYDLIWYLLINLKEILTKISVISSIYYFVISNQMFSTQF